MIRNNPNASVAAVAGAVTVILVWAVGFAGLEIPGEVSSAFTTLLIVGILFAGRRRK